MDGSEIDTLRARIKQLEYENGTTYCAYCGERFSDPVKVGQHIRTCEKHPMRASEKLIDELKCVILGNLAEFDNCPCVWCKYHNTSCEEHCSAISAEAMADIGCPMLKAWG